MFHIAANFVALANVANTEVPALNDDVMQIRNGRLTPGEPLSLIQAYSSAVTLLRTRLNSPTPRQAVIPFLTPIGTTLLPPTDPNVADFRDNPFRLQPNEGLVWESTDSAVGPNNHYIITWLQRAFEPAPNGQILTIRGTSAGPAVASAWTTIGMTWDQDLANGNYAVIGGMCISTTCVAFCLMFEGQDLRPGGLGSADAGVRPPWWQLKGGMGLWGRFRSLAPPLVRVLCNAADAAFVVFLDVVRIS